MPLPMGMLTTEPLTNSLERLVTRPEIGRAAVAVHIGEQEQARRTVINWVAQGDDKRMQA